MVAKEEEEEGERACGRGGRGPSRDPQPRPINDPPPPGDGPSCLAQLGGHSNAAFQGTGPRPREGLDKSLRHRTNSFWLIGTLPCVRCACGTDPCLVPLYGQHLLQGCVPCSPLRLFSFCSFAFSPSSLFSLLFLSFPDDFLLSSLLSAPAVLGQHRRRLKKGGKSSLRHVRDEEHKK